MSLLLTILVLSAILPETGATFWSCPPGFVTSDSINCFKYVDTEMDLESAANTCESDGAGLAIIRNAFVNSFVVSQFLNQSSTQGAWIGVTCEQTLDSCQNDDKSALQYDNFEPGRQFGSNKCVLLSRSSRWTNNVACTIKKPFVCGTKTVKTVCPDGWDRHIDHCYKYFEELSTLMEADSTCKKANGNVASLHSDSENEFVRNLATAKRAKHFVYLAIGLQADGHSSKYWLDNSALDYANIDFDDEEFGQCYAMSLDIQPVKRGAWTRGNCSTPAPFVCKTATADVTN